VGQEIGELSRSLFPSISRTIMGFLADDDVAHGHRGCSSDGRTKRITKSKNLDHIRDEVVDSLPLRGVLVQKGH
jgi:hypothetical protein